MSCNSCCDTSCPAPVAVNINVTELNFDGESASFQVAIFSRAAGTITADSAGVFRVITLPAAVSQAASVSVALDSGVQRPGVDYVVSGNQVYLNAEAHADAQVVVKWFSTAASTAIGDDSTGTLRGFASNPGVSWLEMESGTAHSKATFAALWVYLAANTDLVDASDATTFTLIDMTFPFYNGSSLQTLPGYIHV